MVKIGYVGRADGGADAAVLKSQGCHVVRTENHESRGGDTPGVLSSILEFIGKGDQLVVGRLDQLALTSRGVLAVLERLEGRGASLHVLEPGLCTEGEGGRALRAALEAVAAIEGPTTAPRRRPAETQEIRALRRAGLGPVEIARRLGVSRMTVWRKLRTAEA
jgi:DNA invertase Pin-like site-specific DNA recombinase